MYANSASGQLNKKARCQEGMKARAHGADGKRARRHDVKSINNHMSLRGDFVPFRIMGKRINTGMSLRGNDCILGCRGNLFDLFTQGKPFRFGFFCAISFGAKETAPKKTCACILSQNTQARSFLQTFGLCA